MDDLDRINDDTAMSMSRLSASLVVFVIAGLLACGGAQPQPAAPEPSDTPPQAPTKAEAPATPVAEQAPTPTPPKEPYGQVVEILPGKDDPADRRARVEIFNPTGKPCRFKAYTLRWGDSSKSMPLNNAELDPGTSRQRFLIVHPNDGDIESLTAEGSTLEVDVECGP